MDLVRAYLEGRDPSVDRTVKDSEVARDAHSRLDVSNAFPSRYRNKRVLFFLVRVALPRPFVRVLLCTGLHKG